MPRRLLFQNAAGDVFTEEELKCRFREDFDEAYPAYELAVAEDGRRYTYTFSPARIVEELDPALFREQFTRYQDWHGWQEVGSNETEATLESWRKARSEA